ncbi:hypothetical protein D1872_327770 [compost metagenome]
MRADHGQGDPFPVPPKGIGQRIAVNRRLIHFRPVTELGPHDKHALRRIERQVPGILDQGYAAFGDPGQERAALCLRR